MALKKMNKFLWMVAVAGVLIGCEKGSENKGSSFSGGAEPIYIGVAAPFTGESSQFGDQVKMSLELFKSDINKQGGINGRPLEYVYADDSGKAEQAQTVATSLADNNKVLAVVGHFNSSCSLAGKRIYDQAKLVMFSPASTNVEVTHGSPYLFRNIFTDDFQGRSLADYAGKILGAKRVGIIYENDDYGTGLKNSFKSRAEELGMEIPAEIPYNRDVPDFRSQLMTLHGINPQCDLLLVAGLYTQAANILRQARVMGIRTPVIGGEGLLSQEFIVLGGTATEGTIISCPFLPELGGEKAKKFTQEFEARNSKEPDAWGALSYDAVSMLVEGIRQNGATREGIAKYMQGVTTPEKAFQGVVGKIYFDENGDCLRALQMAVVKNGKFVPAEKQIEQ